MSLTVSVFLFVFSAIKPTLKQNGLASMENITGTKQITGTGSVNFSIISVVLLL